MNLLTNRKEERNGGFTLLELLIVIAIIAILSVALVFMLNPAEVLKKSRDAQRISDLKTVKTALGIMLTSTSTPSLDGVFSSTANTAGDICLTTTTGVPNTTSAKIAYSSSPTVPTGVPTVPATGDVVATAAFTAAAATAQTAAVAGKVDGSGWIPVNLKALVGGTPISNFPVDPINTVSLAITIGDLVYRYACQNGTTAASGKPAFVFEIDAVLESNAYGIGGTDDKSGKDGGDNANFYETGNSLNLLPISGAF